MVSEEGLEKGMFAKIRVFLEMIKFSHTVFALPFAFTGAVLAADGMPSAHQVFWILMAMVGARTAAMGMNRLIDAEIDARNPRTASRAIPAGLIGTGTVALFIVLSILLMLYAAWQLNPLCLYLSPVALFFLGLYSYCKRFTSLAHVVLGICLAAAPLGAWIAIRGTVEVPAILLGLAVLFWVAGFDILYALQDLDFDRASGLHSIPVRLGVNGSLWAARVFHLVMLGLLAGLYLSAGLGPWFLAGLAATIAMLGYEHWLLRHGDLTKLDAAFFTMNGYISITLFVATLADVLAGRGGV
ncbi:putative 4-hydroxybenzoate polyprenyltransferase [Geobacter sulfurreducens]|uniref:4-hydroxybenzoate polyprenyltransferase n=1 Tax=Geobacter sulfurreducens (strain ATCC 51573 / DSM 12127 / PCA) TaxID=243231 RepID=Q74G13_GEOSL|nr:4-hydroxybenzoate octaprenyltransferase [Geobacter sulfurreducens]AAR33771.1 menaquinone biosynthesis polyprenyltransferase, putative [Geobacter sulfurreducens PCA]ADI83277.2 menaquinone biosynthesis polyprenyltransferase, putative [Geobacter sulfurreducens KN400]AJY71922.1 prenyltransferase [Geobacter sulfurreducens]UAC05758.1 putative 4-hydroxybenzoate polyprenyltransferase [Geobacter sulfurreducens]UTG94388.1 putative 4-hydroxybenzoate polyprenyltransferase [Geobacter sulfurreducens]